jgi:excisionase family DNA binding protein
MDTPKRYISPRKLADILDVAVSWIYAQAEGGYLPHYKCGKYLRFDLGEVQTWLQQRKRGGDGQAA